MKVTTDDALFERLQHLIGLASNNRNVHEALLAARRIHEHLDRYQLPVRYIVPVGTVVRLVPTTLAKTASARAASRDYTSQRVNVFTELHRVKGVASQQTLARGHFLFDRHGYYVFVPVKSVRVAL